MEHTLQDMHKNIYAGDFAGERLIFSFRHKDTVHYFNNWLVPSEAAGQMVYVPQSDCGCWIREYGMKDDGNTEFSMSINRASDILSHTGRCVIHAAAFTWDRRAYLLAADSGTGKSTQLRHLLDLYPGEVRVINGDKPLLRLEADETLTVHPSPWKGKEEWGDDSLSAPLEGIILLKQGMNNSISRQSPIYCAARLLSLIFSAFEKEDDLHALCRIEECILRTVPIWHLVNLGDEASARMVHDTVLAGEGARNDI